MNSVFVNLGIYLCAVDAFLEISMMHLFLPYLSSLCIINDFTDLLSMFVHIKCLRAAVLF